MDLNLPVLDGFTAALRIRERAETRDVPIVAVTAYDTAEFRRAARAVGCSEYVAKPVGLEQLLNLVNRLLAQTREDALESEPA
jgi:two-component system, cell cycle response regulator DivK